MCYIVEKVGVAIGVVGWVDFISSVFCVLSTACVKLLPR